MVLVITCVLVGCAEQPMQAPHVRLMMANSAEPLAAYLDGARAWEPLGFDVEFGERGEFPACDPHWWQTGDVDCQLSLWITRIPMLRERNGTDALSDLYTNSIAIDTRVVDYTTLRLAAAHEAGHLLLQTGRHTVNGIMSGMSFRLYPDDRALACETIQLCED